MPNPIVFNAKPQRIYYISPDGNCAYTAIVAGIKLNRITSSSILTAAAYKDIMQTFQFEKENGAKLRAILYSALSGGVDNTVVTEAFTQNINLDRSIGRILRGIVNPIDSSSIDFLN